MKKNISFIIIMIVSILVFASCNKPEPPAQTTAASRPAPVVSVPETKISNEFSQQLPEFSFSSPIADSYDESLRYIFSVNCSHEEFNNYLSAIKSAGFTLGYPEQAPVSGNGYYKASNQNKYMIEMVYKNGELTVDLTRP